MKKLYESFIKNCCASLQRTTVTSVDAVHTYASALAYVDAPSRGATLDVWLAIRGYRIKRGVAL